MRGSTYPVVVLLAPQTHTTHVRYNREREMLEELRRTTYQAQQHQTTIKLVDINAIEKRLQTARGIGQLARRVKKRAHGELKE